MNRDANFRAPDSSESKAGQANTATEAQLARQEITEITVELRSISSVVESTLVYRRLLCCCMGDRGQAERLIAYESRRFPDLETHALVERALATLERDMDLFWR